MISISLQRLLRLYDLYGYNNYSVPMIYIVTANIPSPWPISLQQLLQPYDLNCHSNYNSYVPTLSCTCVAFSPFAKLNRFFPKNSYVPRISTVSANITTLYSILLQQLLRPYDLFWYSTYYVHMTYIVTASTTSICSILLQHLLRL